MRSILISLLFVFYVLISPQLILAANFSLTPNQGNLTQNVTTSVEITLSSSDPINAVSAVINYPADLLNIVWVKTDSLAFDIAVEQSIENGQIRISKGALTPVSGSNIHLATIGVTPKITGSTALNFTDSSAIMSASDANNVLDLPSSLGASFSIISQSSNSNSPAGSAPASPASSPSVSADINNNNGCEQVASLKSKLINKYKSISKAVVRLDTISTLTDNYYQTKLVPQNFLLPNYSKYRDQIQANKKTALVQLSSLQNNVIDFNCANAKEKIGSFKSTVATLKKDLLNYRQANTNLLINLKGI